jgi:hypothetical protein
MGGSSNNEEGEEESGGEEEQEVEQQIEDFRRRMEKHTKESTLLKHKMKPNITNDWLRELRLRLKSTATTPSETSMERQQQAVPKLPNHRSSI